MRDYTIIASDDAFLSLLDTWRQKGINLVAMDFEGEFNLHVYGEHLCLIQLYDGHDFYLIDPFIVSARTLKSFLEADDIEKIMFDCASDASLVRKQYGIQLRNICDLRVMAMALGFMGNLTGLIEQYVPRNVPLIAESTDSSEKSGSKKKNQMTNWMKRPLTPSQLVYALEDVAHLFVLRSALVAEIAKAGLEEKVAALMRLAPLPKGPEKPGWEKLPGWRYLSRTARSFARAFFLVRDDIARKRNVPAARVLDKNLLVSLSRMAPLSRSAMEDALAVCPAADKLLPLMMEAQEKAAKK
ncbi:HRDC domain-containing protein [Parasphaerochaeta coccoides]|uniref:3'-5' exonuclease n=1 Tax=Parasphaerochaeta coccoides (strain ATCC BAA-1237 / DSM 17374 / SPN1) TaxID=760011 RepID=F4GM48_PARC1|nr:HRDC domain-containing protein [Parasphaerochaeta coccoides]AEC02523.1 3'-5' exonuclease [Parasphaerochaeta coccoides DSM 17374]